MLWRQFNSAHQTVSVVSSHGENIKVLDKLLPVRPRASDTMKRWTQCLDVRWMYIKTVSKVRIKQTKAKAMRRITMITIASVGEQAYFQPVLKERVNW